MTTTFAYAKLAEFRDYATDRGGNVPTPNVIDDGVVRQLLLTASRYLDYKTGRRFDPHVATRYYSVPSAEDGDPRELVLDSDLLEVLSITNGDGSSIASTEYILRPRNESPYRRIRLKDTSTYYWALDAAGGAYDVIAVSGIWGFHSRYADAWETITTAAEAMDASETGYDVTSGSGFVLGDLIRFDNEIAYISSVSDNTLTIARGANGSTATTHLTGIDVKVWRFADEIKNATIEIANNAYHRRFGQSLRSEETITAAGIVLSPREIPQMAKELIKNLQRYT
jgi:hypothetical protein